MKLSILPAALAYSPIRRGYGLADLETPRYARSRSGRGPRLAQAGRAIKPGPGGLKPRAAAAATARCVPSRRWRSSHSAGDRLLSGAARLPGGHRPERQVLWAAGRWVARRHRVVPTPRPL